MHSNYSSSCRFNFSGIMSCDNIFTDLILCTIIIILIIIIIKNFIKKSVSQYRNNNNNNKITPAGTKALNYYDLQSVRFELVCILDIVVL